MKDAKRQSSRKLADLARRYGVSLVVLFGSEAKGAGREDSDVDLAVWTEKRLSPRREIALMAEMSGLFPGRTTDVAILNESSPLLRFEVSKAGVPLYEERPGAFLRFRLMAVRQYWETEKFRRMRARFLRRAAEAR